MKVSIIMPSLNVANYIDECIVSVQNQTLKDIEIICVDAGSTDGTREILQRYADLDSRIKIIDSDVKSYGYQMNLGLDVARGEYIGIVETDDYVSDDMFEKLYEKTRKEHPDFVKAAYREFFMRGDKKYGRHVYSVNTKNRSGELIELEDENSYRLADINHIWSAIYKRKFLEEKGIRFNETPGASFQDVSFSMLVGLTAKTCIYLNDYYYCYRTDRPESSVKSASKVGCVISELNYVYKYIEDNKIDIEPFKNDLVEKKIDIFFFDSHRLSDTARQTFLEMIQEDMIDINNQYFAELDEEHQSYLEQLLDIEKMNAAEEMKFKDTNDFVSCIKKLIDDKCILVGAGRYFDKLDEIQQIIGKNFIKEVCDNSKNLWGAEVNGYIVQSVDDAMANHKNEKWLIANRKYSEEIKKQLIEGGIHEDDIKAVTYIPDVLEIVDELLK